MFHLERQARDQFRFGKDFLTERDVLGEYLLDQARQRIENDQFIQTRMAKRENKPSIKIKSLE